MEHNEETPAESFISERERLYTELTKKPEIAEALAILDGLPDNLRYHNKAHTEDVLKETILFALGDGVDMEVLEEQAIAAAWHDVGYIEQYEHNEPIAVKLFENSEAYKTLSESTRNEIISNILDTQLLMREGEPYLVQERSKYAYILDADVSNFGKADFWDKRLLVAEELGIDLSNPETKKKFYAFALKLLKNHEWKTASARMLRQTQKEKNLARAEEEFASLNI
jgi:hypothetical protein